MSIKKMQKSKNRILVRSTKSTEYMIEEAMDEVMEKIFDIYEHISKLEKETEGEVPIEVIAPTKFAYQNKNGILFSVLLVATPISNLGKYGLEVSAVERSNDMPNQSQN